MTEKMPTTKPQRRLARKQPGAIALIHERSITVLHPAAHDDMHRLPVQRLPWKTEFLPLL